MAVYVIDFKESGETSHNLHASFTRQQAQKPSLHSSGLLSIGRAAGGKLPRVQKKTRLLIYTTDGMHLGHYWRYKMRFRIRTNIFLMILVALFSASGASAAGIGKNIVVLLAGEGLVDDSGNQFTQLGLVAPEGVLCFDMNLVNARTGKVIGSGSDCLSDITPSENGGMSLTATSFFHFRGGSLVSQGLVTVQPKLHGLEEFTHVTGAAPASSENNVIYGDGRFKDASGSVRLSGLVNLSRFESGYIDFDCVFIIDIWNKRHRTDHDDD